MSVVCHDWLNMTWQGKGKMCETCDLGGLLGPDDNMSKRPCRRCVPRQKPASLCGALRDYPDAKKTHSTPLVAENQLPHQSSIFSARLLGLFTCDFLFSWSFEAPPLYANRVLEINPGGVPIDLIGRL